MPHLADSVTLPTTGVYAFIGFLVAVLALVSPLGAPVRGMWKGGAWLVNRRAEGRQAARGRQGFARHIEAQLLRLSDRDDWSDERFTELEAEVEIEGHQRRLVPWGARGYGKRRVNSLSTALTKSTERLIILQGMPGAGKSVALRHVALGLAEDARRNATAQTVLPLYVNLKEFRPAAHPVTSEHVREFVMDSLNRANNRDVDRYLAAEFDVGLREGRWLFLFDSFDEIPDVLDATGADETVTEYTYAIEDFLGGPNQCRGIVGSREFKGPRRSGWPRFTIAELTRRQQTDLIDRALATDQEAATEVIAGLRGAESSVADLARNPMLLSLLCEHVHATRGFPAGAHSVFETFVTTRLTRDEGILGRRFALAPDELRRAAETIAFGLTDQPGLGLEPTRGQILDTLAIGGTDRDRMHTCFEALEYVKLAIPPETAHEREERTFTFVHRRFQEYFATCVVLRDPDLVPPETLLLSGLWRETAVAVLQLGSPEQTAGLRVAAEAFVEKAGAEVRRPLPEGTDETAHGSSFVWPDHALHVLELLTDGLPPGSPALSATTRESISALLLTGWKRGGRHDRVWVIDACGLAEPAATREILDMGFAAESVLLRDATFRQLSRLRELTAEQRGQIGRALARLSIGGELRRERISTYALIRRLGDPAPLLASARLLIAVPFVGFAVHLAWVALAVGLAWSHERRSIDSVIAISALLLLSTAGAGAASGSSYAPRGQMMRIWLLHSEVEDLGFMLGGTQLGFMSLVALAVFQAAGWMGYGWLAVLVLTGLYAWSWRLAAVRTAALVHPSGYWRWPLLAPLEAWSVLRDSSRRFRAAVPSALRRLFGSSTAIRELAEAVGFVIGTLAAFGAVVLALFGLVKLITGLTGMDESTFASFLFVPTVLVPLALTVISRRRIARQLVLVRGELAAPSVDAEAIERLLGRITSDRVLFEMVSELRRRGNASPEVREFLFTMARERESMHTGSPTRKLRFRVGERTLDEIGRLGLQARAD